MTQLVKADAGTVLISNSDKARIELRAKGDLGGNLAKLASAEAGLEIAYVKDMHTQFVAARGVTPLFKGLRIKPDFWFGRLKEPRVVPLGEHIDDPMSYFEEAAPL